MFQRTALGRVKIALRAKGVGGSRQEAKGLQKAQRPALEEL
jgi:hypothetical protein